MVSDVVPDEVPVTVRGQIHYICPYGEDTMKYLKPQKCPPEVDIFVVLSFYGACHQI